MKKLLLLAISVLFAAVALAQKQELGLKRFDRAAITQSVRLGKVANPMRTIPANVRKAPRRAESDFPIIKEQPEGELKTFTRSGDYLYVEGQSIMPGTQGGRVSIVFGTDGAIYIKDPLMGTNFGSWVSGTYDADNGKVTIPVPQNLVYVSNYDACVAMVPITSYSTADFTSQDITYTVTESEGKMVLTLDGFTDYNKTLGGAWTDDQSVQVYGEYNTVLTEAGDEDFELVVAPEGAEFKEYAMSYTDYNKSAASRTAWVAVVGDDVYLKGYSTYIPDALIKGTKEGNTVTFAANQWLGSYSGYDSYFMPAEAGGSDAVFTFDPEADTYTATGNVFSLVNGQYIDVYTTNPVLTAVKDVAAMPANPSIKELTTSDYGMMILFDVPIVDVNEKPLVGSKLYYQFFTNVEGVESPLVFTPATHENLTEDTSIFPFGFTDNYDFNQGQIFLNGLYSDTWNKLGIKSIYTGGGETNATEIQWYTIKEEEPQPTGSYYKKVTTADELTDGEYLIVCESANVAFNGALGKLDAVGNNISVTIADGTIAAAEDVNAATFTINTTDKSIKSASDLYIGQTSDANGLQSSGEEVYANDITIGETGEADIVCSQAHLRFNATSNQMRFRYYKSATYAAQQAITLYKKVEGDNPDPGTEYELVVPPADAEVDTWQAGVRGTGVDFSTAQVASTAEGDVYVSGLFSAFPEAWIKGTLEDDIVTFPSRQYLGTIDVEGEKVNGFAVKANVTETGEIFDTFTMTLDGDNMTLTLNLEEGEALLASSSSEQLALIAHEWIDALVLSYVEPAEELVTLPEGAEVEEWTFEGSYNTQSAKSVQKAVGVAIVGNDIYAQGFANYFPEAWLKGTINGTTVTFANGQFVGEDDEGKEYMLGVANDGKTITDIVFDYDAEAQKLTLSSQTPYIAENGDSKTSLSMYGYWTSVKLYAGEPVIPEVVVLPEGAEVAAYSMAYKDNKGAEATKPVNVAVVDNEVYFQGMSNYLPEAWVKGTLADGNVTFEAMQYMGKYADNDSYFFYGNAPVVFTYDTEAETYSATGQVYGVLGDRYYDGNYTDPVLSKVVEKAATPATPSITGVEESQYGDVVLFNVPTVDVNGDAMVASKLSYQFFVDDESTPLTFTPEYFTKLTEEMTVIPYGFTENYDIYADQIYLNMPHDTWTRLGLQSTYAGGGEEHKSEIFWFDMPEKVPPVTAPEGLETTTCTFKADAKVYSSEEEGEFEPYDMQVEVGFDGDDAYIQGLAKDAPELWVKATKNGEGKYVIPANQFMGNLDVWGYKSPYYWTAVEINGTDTLCVDAVLNFDAEAFKFTSDQTLALNGAADALDYYILFNDVVIEKFIEVAATPADPVFEKFNLSEEVGYTTVYASIPTVDVDGNALNVNKLYYILWVEKNGEQKPYVFSAELYAEDFSEDVTEVPYTYDGYDIYKGGEVIYLEDSLEELKSWTKVGIQSVYYGLGERRESSIVWSTPTGVSTSLLNGNATTTYDLQGRPAQQDTKGIVIRMVRDANGNVNGVKVLNK